MPESSTHLALVGRIIDHIAEHYCGISGLAVLHDLPGRIGCNKPPKIGVYRPDVYAVDAPLTQTIIGEAKTQGDLDTQHTHKQLTAFVKFLALHKNAVLILAVPWQAKARGIAVLNSIAQRVGTTSVHFIVVDNIPIVGSIHA
jgi:hypothetical protein